MYGNSDNDQPEPLMWRMVSAMNVDLSTPVRDGTMSVDTVRKMLNKCWHCSDPRMCALFLDARGDRTNKPPAFCPNHGLLTELRDRQR